MNLSRAIACVIATMFATSASASSSDKSCPTVAGWQRAIDQKPSPVPYVEAIPNIAIQIGSERWRWNGDEISSAELLQYLRKAAKLNPVPLTLVAFYPQLTCKEKQALQARIARTTRCTTGFRHCLDGTRSEYQKARGRP